ncbi:helix-turn-helix domain-containing protein [Nitratireductor luteus]|uniref:helix-turn-helix domain-containing protein n=1 Tax=Nitratireductor luteus TaxID=2976980 RepID=UPI00223EECD1|nr:helix-turn-helix domain-containing protein [Nitratireductor luteus]
MTDNEPPWDEDAPFLTTKEAARFLKLKPNTLEKMRVYGGGPIYRKHGRHVRYHIDDLNDWSNLRKKDSTADE